MLKKAIALLLIIAAVYWSFYVLLPSNTSNIDTDKNKFSTARALVHLEEISKEEHPVGSVAHEQVRGYIVEELNKLGFDTHIQEGYSISQWGNFSKPKNILARLKGTNNSKALLLLSHYDSSPHSSFGASDAGSGVVTILEGLRAFLNNSQKPQNDIIVLISDSEELGLNGADIFVNKHEWAKDVGLVLNFEARGSGGPSYMLIETNQGNASLMKGFVEANPKFPVANSLAYSIYKMLPNDTDLTRFREDGDIDGFNFAFIDDHFDYHTANDTYERLDRNTLEHQGSYLMPLLDYYAKADLSNVKSNEDYIYFNVPLFHTVIYPFAWIWPMLIIAFVLFIGLVIYGFKSKRLIREDVIKGIIPALLSIIVSGGVGFALWKAIKWMYPEYGEMLHGFTYNGHTYIWAFAIMTVAICLWIYSRFYKPGNVASILVAPIFIWLLVCVIVALKLEGASFFIIPVYFALASLFVLIKQRKPNLALMAILAFPLLTIMSPFIKMFPIGLGLGILFGSCILTALIFVLLLPVFGFFKHKRRWSYIVLCISIFFLISAHFKSSFTEERQKPNSLVYVLNTDDNSASWATYDKVLDSWTKNYLGEDAKNAASLKGNVIASKYGSGFTFSKATSVKDLKEPKIEIYKDTIINDLRHLSVYIKPQRSINRIELFSQEQYKFKDFKINGVASYKKNLESYAFENRRSGRLFTYFMVDNEPLEMQFTVPKEQSTELIIYEASNDLLDNPLFSVPERSKNMIPKPFILNDAVIITKTIKIE